MVIPPGYQSESERKVSKFHSFLNQNNRLDKLWISCNTLSTNGSLMMWNWKLDAVWRELSADAIPDEAKEMKNINGKLSKAGKDKPKLYTALNEKETFLRKVENREGKGTAYKKPEEDEMD